MAETKGISEQLGGMRSPKDSPKQPDQYPFDSEHTAVPLLSDEWKNRLLDVSLSVIESFKKDS